MTKIPVDVGMIYEGERIRKNAMHVEFGGPKSFGAELFRVAGNDAVEDGKVTVVGPDISEMAEGSRVPLGMLIRASGDKLEEDLEGVFERRMHYYFNYIQGFMHLNSRDTIWCRLSKEAVKAGLKFEHVGAAIIDLFKKEYDVIEKMDITFYTDDKAVNEFIEQARAVYEKRDARLRGMKDEDVDVFYGCVLCQSFAPEHMCTISPERISSCGSISWFDGRAAVKVDPKGDLIEIKKGEIIDPVKGEYTGVNEMTEKKSGGAVDRIFLHSIFEYPHTSCGCFEAIAFYIPEVDGLGVVHRTFKGTTPFGIPFSTMAGQTGGGQQLEGFAGIAIEYIRSPKFFIADGGHERLAWLPKDLVERFYDDIPESVRDKIATEEDATDLDSLKVYLEKVDHPVVSRWKAEETAPAAGAPVAEVSELTMPLSGMPIAAGGGITITFKNAKIYAEKVIIKKK
ncbi:carbon monoxide dehydrogenase/acetyl-CoA synthase subunit alpha [archaeon BMS3Abin16]|nr:carbon monoxide dehydrogenase/acetyl-CoA synthase subunit alpha [archaeon BMS3Abin16]